MATLLVSRATKWTRKREEFRAQWAQRRRERQAKEFFGQDEQDLQDGGIEADDRIKRSRNGAAGTRATVGRAAAIGRKMSPSRLAFFRGGTFADEGPGDFGDLAVVVMDVKAGVAPILDFEAIEFGLGGDLVGAADGGVGLENAEAIVKFHVKGILPAQVADVFDAGKPGFAERGLGLG